MRRQMQGLGLILVASIAVCVAVGGRVIGVLAEQRHRRNERELSADILLAAFRVHDVANRITEAIADEAKRVRS